MRAFNRRTSNLVNITQRGHDQDLRGQTGGGMVYIPNFQSNTPFSRNAYKKDCGKCRQSIRMAQHERNERWAAMDSNGTYHTCPAR